MKRVCIALALLATACNGGGSDDDGGIVNLDPGMGGNGGIVLSDSRCGVRGENILTQRVVRQY